MINDGVHRDLLLLTLIVSCFSFLLYILELLFTFYFIIFPFLDLCLIPMLTRTSNPPLVPPFVRGALFFLCRGTNIYNSFVVRPNFKARTTASLYLVFLFYFLSGFFVAGASETQEDTL